MLKIITAFYGVMTMIAMFSSTTVATSSMVPGVVAMWVALLIYTLGFRYQNKAVSVASESQYATVEKRDYIGLCAILGIVAIVLSSIVTKFYVGKSFPQVIAGMLAGQSLYAEYQEYFASSTISQFSISKIPFILSGAALKFIVLFVPIAVLITNREVKKIYWIICLVPVSAYVLFSVARGTSMELFEIAILAISIVFIRGQLFPGRKSQISNAKRVIVTLSLMLVTAIGFNYNVTIRSDAVCMTSELCEDKYSLVHEVSPALSEASYRMFGYLGFGSYVTSTYLTQKVFDSPSSILFALAPSAIGYDRGFTLPELLCDIELDCGYAWVPDLSRTMYGLGFLFWMSALFIVGSMSRSILARVVQNAGILDMIIFYFTLVYIITFPFGNVVTASSSNWIVLTLVIGFKLVSSRVNLK